MSDISFPQDAADRAFAARRNVVRPLLHPGPDGIIDLGEPTYADPGPRLALAFVIHPRPGADPVAVTGEIIDLARRAERLDAAAGGDGFHDGSAPTPASGGGFRLLLVPRVMFRCGGRLARLADKLRDAAAKCRAVELRDVQVVPAPPNE